MSPAFVDSHTLKRTLMCDHNATARWIKALDPQSPALYTWHAQHSPPMAAEGRKAVRVGASVKDQLRTDLTLLAGRKGIHVDLILRKDDEPRFRDEDTLYGLREAYRPAQAAFRINQDAVR
jgi:hypothetical protein